MNKLSKQKNINKTLLITSSLFYELLLLFSAIPGDASAVGLVSIIDYYAVLMISSRLILVLTIVFTLEYFIISLFILKKRNIVSLSRLFYVYCYRAFIDAFILILILFVWAVLIFKLENYHLKFFHPAFVVNFICFIALQYLLLKLDLTRLYRSGYLTGNMSSYSVVSIIILSDIFIPATYLLFQF